MTQVAMKATGVYYRPVWAVLEGQFELMLVNPQHIKAVQVSKARHNPLDVDKHYMFGTL